MLVNCCNLQVHRAVNCASGHSAGEFGVYNKRKDGTCSLKAKENQTKTKNVAVSTGVLFNMHIISPSQDEWFIYFIYGLIRGKLTNPVNKLNSAAPAKRGRLEPTSTWLIETDCTNRGLPSILSLWSS